MTSKLEILDLILLVLSMLASALIGLYFTNKNKSIDSYMLGDRKLSVLPVAVSLMTSCTSGLSLLGCSDEFYYQGPSYAFIAVAILLSGPITAYTILPVFHRMNELSLYKYLQVRYGNSIKFIVSIAFMVQMIFYNSVVLYLPSMALQAILGVPKFYSILIIGLMCVFYSAIGGLKAVVWTDLFQASMMYAAIIIVGIIGTIEAGGFLKVIENADKGGRLDLDGFFNFDLTTRHTIYGVLFGSTIKHVYLIGVNQVQIQRALSLPNLKQAQYSFILCSIFTALISLLSTYMGIVMYSAYKSCDPYLANEIPRRDAIIVHYVANRLKNVPGLRGIFVAGIFSATLSTLSSFSNSMAALAIEDFIKPILFRINRNNKSYQLKDSSMTWLAKIFATSFGIVCVIVAFIIDKANSRLLQATTTLFGAIGVPFLASFALGIFTRYTNKLGILAGFLTTLTFGTYITIYQTFFSPSLQPSRPVYYNEQCALVFNMTISPNSLPELEEVFTEAQLLHWPITKPIFNINQISYMTLPAIQFILTILVASIVSILTGGLKQDINEKYLVAAIHRKKTKPTIDSRSTSINSDNMNININNIINNNNNNNNNINNNSNNRVENEFDSSDDSLGEDKRRKLGVSNKVFVPSINDDGKIKL